MKALFYLSVALAAARSQTGLALTLEFANVEGVLRFDGTQNTFLFSAGIESRNQLIIYRSDSASQDATDKFGSIRGAFTIGPIISEAQTQTAQVSGLGRLELIDGAGHLLTGTLSWDTITTTATSPGGVPATSGFLRPGDAANLTDIRYDGQLSDYVTLATVGAARVNINFQFVPPRDLAQLTADGTSNSTSFVGNITTVPEPSGLALLGLCLAGLVRYAWRRW